MNRPHLCLERFLAVPFLLLMAGCASSDSPLIRSEQPQKCAQVQSLLEKPPSESLPALQEIALSQNAEVLLRTARSEHYQSTDRLLSHLQLSTYPTGGIPLSLSGALKLVTELFKRGNSANDSELRELRILLVKAREETIKKLNDGLHELQTERERLTEARAEKRKAYAEMIAANLIAQVVPLLAPQEKADKAQRAHAKADDGVRGKLLKTGTLKTELLQLTGCLNQEMASHR